MARDFEDIHDLDDLSDDELRDLVREQLAEHNAIDIDEITVAVEAGTVILGGRVGTDGEKLIAEHVLTDVLGVNDFRNDIFVDPNRRALSPEAVDEHLASEDQNEGLLLGDKPIPIEAEDETRGVDLEVELYGTTDVGKTIVDGAPWIPPESPTPEGFINDRNDSGEDH